MRMRGPLPGRSKVRRYLILLPDEKVLTYHCMKKLKKGDTVRVQGGMFFEQYGTVIRKSRWWKGYTYPVKKAKRPVDRCPACGTKIEVRIA
jgi:hypothetical protein